jgi:hypothetical protein
MEVISLRSALIACSLLAASCSAAQTDPEPSPMTPTPTPTLTCGQACRDDEVGYALDDTMWLLWNENLAGQPSGNQNATVQCPLGGTARITGTTGVASNGIDTVHLTLDLQACASSDIYYSMVFTGGLTWDGSFGSGRANAITFKSSALTVGGSVLRYDMPTLSETCAASFTDTYNASSGNQTGWLVGVFCGRTVSQ